MKNRNLLAAAACLSLVTATVPALAQDETDALRYSYLSPQGTARSIGFGNALGSVGGDFSSLSVNPAGIGIYRRGELTFSPSLHMNGSESTFLGKTMDDDVTRFNISNFGLVVTNAAKGREYERSKWKAGSFAIGFNRMADFNRNYTYGGYTTESSGSERYKIDANRNYDYFLDNENLPSSSLGYLGYNSYLLDTFQGNFETIVDYTKGLNQRRSVREKGGMSEMLLSFGGNYEEKLMLGATIGIPIVRYIREVSYLEQDANNAIPDFTDFTYTERLRTTGAGVNLKLGVIYKPTDIVRFGVAFHTPSWLRLHDEYQAGITANTYAGVNTATTPEGQFDYSLMTPWRTVLSGTVMMGQYGFVSVDYEYVNYRSMRYNFNTNDNEFYFGNGAFSEQERLVNDAIKNTYKGASNLRAGMEIRLMDAFMVRGGVGYYGSPYKNNNGASADRIDISGGVGFRGKHAFVDLAFLHSQYETPEQPYTLPYETITVAVPYAAIKNSQNNIVLTMGVKF